MDVDHVSVHMFTRTAGNRRRYVAVVTEECWSSCGSVGPMGFTFLQVLFGRTNTDASLRGDNKTVCVCVCLLTGADLMVGLVPTNPKPADSQPSSPGPGWFTCSGFICTPM